ncbi:uncharacterized protein LOC128878307 isoform X1 [Hylaeus volcanicus]|uniref:uncharacterized protein LOC128878307 isoform X1 n=1 Tax=Hylaeus volcanicus TaxID=313075 RepID=UPI0023B7B423|nr:uncharacterized protein LOC128878307 isoform X1 [Hylaeus volcanicus]
MFAIMPMETEGHGREFGRRQKMRAKCTVEFVCKYCQRRFTKPYNLMIHERSHKDDVTFTCEVCGKSFKRQDNLKQHRYHFSLFLFFLPLVFFLFIIFLLSHREISPRTREIFFFAVSSDFRDRESVVDPRPGQTSIAVIRSSSSPFDSSVESWTLFFNGYRDAQM